MLSEGEVMKQPDRAVHQIREPLRVNVVSDLDDLRPCRRRENQASALDRAGVLNRCFYAPGGGGAGIPDGGGGGITPDGSTVSWCPC